MDEITLDQAIRLLVITDIKKLKAEDLKVVERKIKSRWHPDLVHHKRETDPNLYQRFQENFIAIEPCIAFLESYLRDQETVYEQPIREKEYAPGEEELGLSYEVIEMVQEMIQEVWTFVKSTKYKYHTKEFVVSKGFILREVLMEELKDDIPIQSVVAWASATVILIWLVIIGRYIEIPLWTNGLLAIWCIHTIACFLMFLPLSRIWLPDKVLTVTLWLVNFGNRIHRKTYGKPGCNPIVAIVYGIPVFIANVIALIFKKVILYPLYSIAGLFLGDKTVGQVKEEINFYGGYAERYIEKLITMAPQAMNRKQVLDLSSIFTELKNAKQQ
ncbi:hypothetical protein COB64_03825 [Candidatus Wolfebacteria bacterium]|nr:MAG: hypothetical protein COB64_03825 [Candidatus Wolfebacteria bacterium]